MPIYPYSQWTWLTDRSYLSPGPSPAMSLRAYIAKVEKNELKWIEIIQTKG